MNSTPSPPQPLPEFLWGDQWRFAALPASEVVSAFSERPIPITAGLKIHHPSLLGLASALPIPGVVIDGGRQSLRFARWIDDVKPASLRCITGNAGSIDGLILKTQSGDRWVLATFQDLEVKAAAQTFVNRQHMAQGLHFLLVQPDDSGMTYSGYWLLKEESKN
jgi:RNA-binding protein Tab2/Atab2